VDDPSHCTFHAPAVVRRGPVTVAVGTGGASPALAKHLRQEIEATVGNEYAQLAALLAELRPRVQARVPPEKRESLWRALISALLPFLRDGQETEARQAAEKSLEQAMAGDLSPAARVKSEHL
jgi:precorrin-2 dehydrogenase/sirohydrochlorin ferrochelatase